jgi:D-lactate dehydrogenase (cytochrome)
VTDDSRLPTADCQPFLEDAAHYPGGHATGIVFPRTTDDIGRELRKAATVLPIGAQSSLTGGATPMGEVILSTSRMHDIVRVTDESITVQPGVTVAAMQERLRALGAWFPPAPTFTGATAGGIVATNAAGAATFKYGSTRGWVQALTVVLADGSVLDVERGRQHALSGRLTLETRHGRIDVPVPGYRMPDVPKRSAGYFAEPGMDLIDLFIGSEGTLGVIAEITFRVVPHAPSTVLAFVPCDNERSGLALVEELRSASVQTWHQRDPHGLDVAAIEHMDRRSLQILREDGADRRHNVRLPAPTELALLIQIELDPTTTRDHAFAAIADALTDAPDGPLVRFSRILDRVGLLANTEIALPGERRRMEEFVAVREAVPAGVNQRVGIAKRTIDPRIEKTAADMIVPFARIQEMMALYRREFEARGLDYAVWGHISDGNVHPNVIPRSLADVTAGKDAILQCGREVTRLGGCPLAEHGVGRNPVKQTLLRELYGDAGIEAMRQVKRALDREWKLAPGVIFLRP